jgi:hypothetical protein
LALHLHEAIQKLLNCRHVFGERLTRCGTPLNQCFERSNQVGGNGVHSFGHLSLGTRLSLLYGHRCGLLFRPLLGDRRGKRTDCHFTYPPCLGCGCS